MKTNFLVAQMRWYEQRAFSASVSAAQYQRVLLQGVEHVASALRAPGTRARIVAQLPPGARLDNAARNRAVLALYANACGHLLREADAKYAPGIRPETAHAQVNAAVHNPHANQPGRRAEVAAATGLPGQGVVQAGPGGGMHMSAVQLQGGGMQSEMNAEQTMFPGF